MAKLLAVDGNFFLHRALDVCAKRKDPNHLVKNTFSMFLSMVAADAKTINATHVHVSFDAKRSFRHDIDKNYKANRVKTGGTTIVRDDGSEFHTDVTPGSLVKPAREVLDLAGIAHDQRKAMEADDLLGSLAALAGPKLRVVLDTRDKDLARCVNEYVRLWWPIEKKYIDEAGVLKHFGVRPKQIGDYLSLLGDKVDNIPGVPGVGKDTAAKWLAEYGTLDKALKDKKIKARLSPHMDKLVMARKLVTLKTDIKFDIDEMVPKKINPDLADLVWAIPSSLKDLADSQKLLKMKGLFG
jgi:DNA polymerase I